MATEKQYKSLKEFYPFYLSEHSDGTCRTLHFIGTGLVILSFLMFWYTVITGKTNWTYLWVIPFLGYGFAWVGHFFYEKNKPATFKYPWWSLKSDFVMYFDILSGKIGLDNSKDHLVK